MHTRRHSSSSYHIHFEHRTFHPRAHYENSPQHTHCTVHTTHSHIHMNTERLFIIQCLPRAPHDTCHTYVRDAYSPNLSIKCTYSSYQFGLTPLVFLSFLHHHHHHHHRRRHSLPRRRRRRCCRLHVGEENIENCLCARARGEIFSVVPLEYAKSHPN